MRNRLAAPFLGLVMSLFIGSFAWAQGMQASPYAASSLVRGDSLSFTPPNSFDPTYTNGKVFSGPEGILNGASSRKDVPNLQAGYVYYSGKNWRVGYFTLDYIFPIRLGENSIVFGEAHSELQGFSTKATREGDDQVYLSMGGGYRTILRKTTLIGVNCFYDTAQFANRWLSSGGAGFEMAALLPGHDALDMHFNWYGDLSNSDSVINDRRDGLANFDLQVGYSHQLFHGGPDLRLYGTAYKFDDGGGVYGWQTGIELKSSNGVLYTKCETAFDPVNDSYQSVSAFVNIGFQVEKLLKGQNPFVMPEPLFNSPRNMNRLTDKVKRHWRHTTHGILLASNSQTITLVNKRSVPVTLHIGINGGKPGWGKYKDTDFKGFVVNRNCNFDGLVLSRTLQPNTPVPISFDTTNKGKISFVLSADKCPWSGCPQTLGEFTLIGNDNKDTVDISLVNGFNYPLEITSSRGDVIRVDSATGNQNKPNVYPLYCDQCVRAVSPPTPPTFPTCPAKGTWNQSECKKHQSHNPDPDAGDPPCHTGFHMGANYTVSIL